jgi:tetratricopeptide (TPR) repeat protein
MIRRVLALAALPLLPIACAAHDTRAVGHAYYSGQRDEARRQLNELLDSDSDGKALFLNELGVLDLEEGRLDDAYREFNEAGQIMGAFEGSNMKEVGAIVGQEASKIWRGDPYEKSMNSYYLGVIELMRGVNDNARAGFKNAIFNDSSNAGEQYQCDFAPAWFLEGFASALTGDADTEKSDYDKARELAPDCPALAAGNAGNLLVIADVGRGPTKIAVGAHGEATRFTDHPDRADHVEIRVDGKPFGATRKAGDVYFQASTRGGRAFDAVLKGKAIYKTAAAAAGITTLMMADSMKEKYQTGAVAVGIGLLLTSIFVSSAADTRHWTTLPAEVQLFRGTLTPGRHELEVVPSSGRVAGVGRWTLEIPEKGDAVIWARTIP